ncbi:MAG: GNAT family N-acetyltransferase [Pirellulaceae bacterium]
MTLHMRRMETADIDLGMQLKSEAGWNQTVADWRRCLDLEPEGCFVAEWEGHPVGSTTTCVFGSIGWIAMVLVNKAFQHRGIGTRLVQNALDYFEHRAVTTARLDATPLGRPVYERMGFVAEHELVRLEGIAKAAPSQTDVVAARSEHRESIVALDRRATGTDRGRLVDRLLSERPKEVGVVLRDASLLGYVMLRSGSRATQIGPGIATTDASGRALCDWAYGQCEGQPVFIDVPRNNRPAIEWACSKGLREQRHLTRMVRGEPVAEQVSLLWASSGPEKG